MKISNDERLNPVLKDQVQGLRGAMVDQAEKNQLPERFTVKQHKDLPRMIIEDQETGRSTEVPLFAYGEVRRTLSELFGK